jgi:hypothetical protein
MASKKHVVTDDRGSKPDQKFSRQRDRQNYVWKNKELIRTWVKRILLCVRYIGTMWSADFKVIDIAWWLCLFCGDRRPALSSGYDHIAALTLWEPYILCSFSIHLQRAVYAWLD